MFSRNKGALGPPGPPSFSGSSVPISDFDWTATAGTSSAPKKAPSPPSTINQPDNAKVDAEFARFERVAKPMPGGGWYDPINGSPEMPSGVLGEQWDAFIADCGCLGRGSKA